MARWKKLENSCQIKIEELAILQSLLQLYNAWLSVPLHDFPYVKSRMYIKGISHYVLELITAMFLFLFLYISSKRSKRIRRFLQLDQKTA